MGAKCGARVCRKRRARDEVSPRAARAAIKRARIGGVTPRVLVSLFIIVGTFGS
jgi:hypothetical protein